MPFGEARQQLDRGERRVAVPGCFAHARPYRVLDRRWYVKRTLVLVQLAVGLRSLKCVGGEGAHAGFDQGEGGVSRG